MVIRNDITVKCLQFESWYGPSWRIGNAFITDLQIATIFSWSKNRANNRSY